MKREIESPSARGRTNLEDIEGTLGGSVPDYNKTPKPVSAHKIDFVDARNQKQAEIDKLK
jgi:hypothetical protein